MSPMTPGTAVRVRDKRDGAIVFTGTLTGIEDGIANVRGKFVPNDVGSGELAIGVPLGCVEPAGDDGDTGPAGGEAAGPRHPEVRVQLTGQDGNAFFILGRVRQALKRAGVSPEELAEFQKEATSGDYDHLLGTCMAWVDCR